MGIDPLSSLITTTEVVHISSFMSLSKIIFILHTLKISPLFEFVQISDYLVNVICSKTYPVGHIPGHTPSAQISPEQIRLA